MNPFDPKSVLFAKHAQHVVLIHFPIALFLVSVMFDLVSQWKKDRALATVAYYNLLVASISTLPVMATGFLAWRRQLEAQPVKGVLLQRIVLGIVSSALIWLVWWVHFRAYQAPEHDLPRYRWPIELVACVVIASTGHLGGFLSGVNGPG